LEEQQRTLQVQLSAPKQAQNVSLMVAVRVRPILKSEIDRGRGTKDILRVMDDRIVLVMDPDPDDKDYLDQVQNRSKVCFIAQLSSATNAQLLHLWHVDECFQTCPPS
jgi:hypothetical protein